MKLRYYLANLRAYARLPLLYWMWHVKYRGVPTDPEWGSKDFDDNTVMYGPRFTCMLQRKANKMRFRA